MKGEDMKDNILVRVSEFRNQFFVDYCKPGENSWANYSAEKSRDKAFKTIESMREVWSIKVVS